jgi:tetratricopeptide (TPR) repeat protein
VLATLAVFVTVPAAAAEVTTLVVEGMRLTVPVQENLLRLQDQWLLWSSAFLKGDRALAETAVRDLLLTTEEMGFAHLSGVSLGIAARAVEAAREGDGERALWALEMAERLDPGRPETAFARMRVARLDGRYAGAFGAAIQGYWRAFGDDLARRLLVMDIGVWIVLTLMISALLFVALELATKGWALLRDLAVRIGSYSPGPISIAMAGVLLVWPLFLPGGWIWLVLLWAAMLWSYGSSSERSAIAASIVVLCLGPAVLAVLKGGLDVELLPAMRAVERIEDRRLYGQLFRDLAILENTVPESVERRQLVADVQVGWGQDDLARPLYRAIVDVRPENGEALNNLGAYHYLRREHIEAIEFFEQAAGLPSSRLAASYNLGQTYQRLLEFDRADEFLARAREVDSRRVSAWLAEARAPVHLPLPAQGYQRLREDVRAQVSDVPPPWPEVLRGLGLAVGVVLGGIVLGGLRRTTVAPTSATAKSNRWGRILVPGLVSIEAGDGVRALLALSAPVAAVMLPLAVRWGAKLPWPYDPSLLIAWIAGGLVLVGVFAGRAVLALR